MQVQQQPGARPGPGQQQEQEEAAGGGQAAGGQRHLHHHRHRHQVGCDWWTRGHVTRCSHLIGPQLPQRLLRAAVGQPPDCVGRGAVGGDPGAGAGPGRHQPQAQGQVPDVRWGERLGELSVEIYSMQIKIYQILSIRVTSDTSFKEGYFIGAFSILPDTSFLLWT